MMIDRLTGRLERCYTGAVHDVMRARGLRDFVLPPEIRPLFPERRLAGPVFTVSGHQDNAADDHTLVIRDPSLNRNTDRFVIRARKPD